MNRNRQRDRHRDHRPSRGHSQGGFGGDGLLGEGPSGGNPLMSPNSMGLRESQLALAQSLLHQQQLVNAGLGGGVGNDFGSLGGLAGGMHFLQQQQQMRAMGSGVGGGMGGMRNDRKRMGGQLRRDGDNKHRRRDSWGRGDKDRSHANNRGSGQDQDRNRRSRKDSDREKEEAGEDYDPAEPTEDDEEGANKNADSKLYCHVCNISVYDEESFQRHLNGLRHKARMESVLTAHQMKSSQLKSRLKAEEHLRNIERKGGRDPDYFCKICNNDLAIPWEKHRYSNIHKQRLLQVRKGCGWCKVYDFSNFTEVLEHRDTEEHKKNAELYGKKEDAKDSGAKGKDKKKESKEEEEEDLTIPEFDPETPVGVSYVIPVTGFFCKLCHKFYNNEKSAKGSHCQSEVHYEKFKAALEVKIAAREKRKAEEEEKRKQEEAEEGEKEKEGKEEEAGEDEEAMLAEEQEVNKPEADNEEMFEEEDENHFELNNCESTADFDTCQEEDPESFMESEPTSSFVYVDGDKAAEQLSNKPSEEPQIQSQAGNASDADKTADTLDDTDTAAFDAEGKTSMVTSTPSAGGEEAPQVATPAKRATARRGRGRGRAKK